MPRLCLPVRRLLMTPPRAARACSSVKQPPSIVWRALDVATLPTDVKYMQVALAAANDAAGVPIAAAVVDCDGHILSTASNDESVAFRHAELAALELACAAVGQRRLDGCWLFVTAEPCMMCLGAALLSRISRLVYGCASPKYGAFSSGAVDVASARGVHQLLVTGGVCEAEAAELLRRFFAARRAAAAAGEAPVREACPHVHGGYAEGTKTFSTDPCPFPLR